MTFPDSEYPAVPYPGTRPAWSYVHDGGTGWPVSDLRVQPSGVPLDDWLADRGAPGLDDRRPVLAYGSNANPAKLTWLRETLGLQGPAVVLRARCAGMAAVWASGLRVVDDQRPATLCALPGAVEWHAVLLATDDQLDVLDVCEGRGNRYDLAELLDADITVDGERRDGVLAYVGASPIRMPLLVDGAPVRCGDVPQSAAQSLTGTAAPTHGLAVRVIAAAGSEHR